MDPMDKIIRVLVVDDSAVARAFLTKGLAAFPNIEVVGYAINAMDADKKIKALKPDVLTLDVEMLGMNGIEFLKQLLPTNPIPAILVSSLNLRVFDALAAGAIDFVRKPDSVDKQKAFLTSLAKKIAVASCAKVHQPIGMPSSPTAPSPTPRFTHPSPSSPTVSSPRFTRPPQPAVATPTLSTAGCRDLDHIIIGLGASTGGTEATLEVLKRLPADIPGMVIVQHMPTGFTKMYADRLNRICAMEVREAADGDEIHRGLALIAPADLQTRVVRTGNRYTVSCTPGEKVSGHRPSVDALFTSMADNVKCPMVGIIMTGMGRDGATGLLKMREHGAYTIGQDKESCVVYGMPMVAYEIGALITQTSCENIANVLMNHLKTRK